MSEYIKREDIIKWIDDSLEMCGDRYSVDQENMMGLFRTVINDCIPFADVRPVVRGRWNRTDAYPHRLYCSVCYKTYLKNDELLERWEFPLNFCPNCGADMRGEGNV